MKMLMIVLMIRFIVSLFEDRSKANKKVNDTDEMNMKHPAEFRIR
jgi:hypothetical protein